MLWNVTASVISQHVVLLWEKCYLLLIWLVSALQECWSVTWLNWLFFWHLPSGWMCFECKIIYIKLYIYEIIYNILYALFSSPYRNHQCGLQPAVWQVTSRSLSIPAAFPLPSHPCSPHWSSPWPAWSPFLTTNASQCSSKSTASPCPWVWTSTASPSSTWSRWGKITAPLCFSHKQM